MNQLSASLFNSSILLISHKKRKKKFHTMNILRARFKTINIYKMKKKYKIHYLKIIIKNLFLLIIFFNFFKVEDDSMTYETNTVEEKI
jgi:hypothetical protein